MHVHKQQEGLLSSKSICKRLPVSLDHQNQVWPAESGGWSVHAEHLESMLPSKKEQ